MSDLPTIITFARVPPFARGFVRDLRPRWALEEVGQPYRIELVRDAATAEHRRIQPFGQVPAYRDDQLEMFESGAIVIHVAQRWGGLLPSDAAERMVAVQWVAAALSSVEPYVMALVINDVFERERAWSAMRHDKVLDDLHRRLGDLAAALGAREWLGGGDFTAGDLMMVSVLGGLRNTDVLDRHPKLADYVARGEARPGHRKAMADQMALYAEKADA